MHHPIPFSKMHSLGNDFVMIDGVRNDIWITRDLARYISDRKFGIGCDQILVAEAPVDEETDFRFRIFNADGSESAQCGNGARCFARFLLDQGLTTKQRIPVSTLNTYMVLEFESNQRITVNMGEPVLEHSAIPFIGSTSDHIQTLCIDEYSLEFGIISMGNPHAVTLVKDVHNIDVGHIGKTIEHHPSFPERTNVGFLQVDDSASIQLRVFERGVGETLACGSGACAAVVSGNLRGFLDSNVNVSLPGGSLEVRWNGVGTPVYLCGDAQHVFDGQLNPNTSNLIK